MFITLKNMCFGVMCAKLGVSRYYYCAVAEPVAEPVADGGATADADAETVGATSAGGILSISPSCLEMAPCCSGGGSEGGCGFKCVVTEDGCGIS